MRFFSALAFAASLAFVGAQDLQGIPDCALTCFAAAVSGSGCSLSDTKCQCTTGSDAITSSVTSCVPSKCSAEEIAKIAPAVATICAKAGVSISSLPTTVPSASGGSSNGSQTASTTGSQSGTATGSGSAAENTGGAMANVASVGAVALGLAAVLGL
ncbi:hypothetical protein BU26DRAFT_522841 [Trematosphaeria pertusa]|uniref:CFEM domain-containing protein n=1 Tax=Trematosphaeria pertusa TaxID=390896 RepID=A0A6A6I110_9PLEO|nr:uncharacterized protein BU26DRAFT_522841 [Trematosphaeria pertusa]KAF2244135.1 hypothetical protein BU26DRAFT_522841 [Trematosphaeria pertusa]